MSNVAANGNNEKSKIFQTVLSSPGMNEKCKINLMISRQNIVLLGRLIEAGLLSDENHFDDEIIAALPEDSLKEFKTIHEGILRKGELTDFYDRLKLL
jgi:hypothetical protein